MSLLHVHVSIQVRPGMAETFEAATRENARCSREEAGVIRFDFLRSTEDSGRYLLIEIYRDAAAVAAHKETSHYQTWRDTVEDMMAAPRTRTTFGNIDPPDDQWS